MPEAARSSWQVKTNHIHGPLAASRIGVIMALLRFSFVLSTALSCAMLLESGGPVSDTNARPNACLYYLHALVLMPRLEDLSEREKQTIDNWSSAPVDRSAAGLVAKYTEALAYYR